MTETFIALAFAHILADYLLQPAWMVERKKDPGILLLHIAMVMLAAMAATGQVARVEILAIGAAHLLIDAVKTYLLRNTLWVHLGDQAAHFLTVAVVAFISPDLWQSGAWGPAPNALIHAILLAGGLLLATRAGGFAVGILMNEQRADLPKPEEKGLPGGGAVIGQLERGLIFVLVLADMAAGIGFLIAAKSILRFGAIAENRAASEYVIIGTLASFGWAILAGFATLTLQSALPPLEIAPPAP